MPPSAYLSALDEREMHVYRRLRDVLGDDEGRQMMIELEAIKAARVVEAEDSVLLLVARLLEEHGQHDLWRRIYSTVIDDDSAGAADRFLERQA